MVTEQGMENHRQRSKWKNSKIMLKLKRDEMEIFAGNASPTQKITLWIWVSELCKS